MWYLFKAQYTDDFKFENIGPVRLGITENFYPITYGDRQAIIGVLPCRWPPVVANSWSSHFSKSKFIERRQMKNSDLHEYPLEFIFLIV